MNFVTRYRERERERAPAVMCFQQHSETRVRMEFTIDFTSYKVLIIMHYIIMSLMFMQICAIFSSTLSSDS